MLRDSVRSLLSVVSWPRGAPSGSLAQLERCEVRQARGCGDQLSSQRAGAAAQVLQRCEAGDCGACLWGQLPSHEAHFT